MSPSANNLEAPLMVRPDPPLTAVANPTVAQREITVPRQYKQNHEYSRVVFGVITMRPVILIPLPLSLWLSGLDLSDLASLSSLYSSSLPVVSFTESNPWLMVDV
ncbi:unnamed protein product [Ectocarpus sp. 12 AP-2014]